MWLIGQAMNPLLERVLGRRDSGDGSTRCVNMPRDLPSSSRAGLSSIRMCASAPCARALIGGTVAS